MTQKTKQRIITNSLPFFVQYGYKEARVDDLAEYLGLTKKTIYNYFGSKQEVLLTALESDVNNTITRVDSLLSNKSISYANRMGILFYLAYFKIQERKQLFPDMDASFKPKGKMLADIVTRIQTELLKFIKKLMTNGIQANHFRSDLDIKCTSSMILSMLIGIPVYNFNALEPTNPSLLLQESVKIVVRGITSELGYKTFEPNQISHLYQRWLSEREL